MDQAAKIWAIWGEARCQGAWGAGSRLPAQYFQHCKNIFIMTISISSTARIFSLRLKVFPVLPKKQFLIFFISSNQGVQEFGRFGLTAMLSIS